MKNKKQNNRGQLVTGIIIVLIFAAVVYGIMIVVKLSQSDDTLCVDANCCIIRKLGNGFDVVSQKCIVIPPVGNPTALPLVKVTDSDNNVIKPPTGQDAIIMPVSNTTLPLSNVTNKTITLPNMTNITYMTNVTNTTIKPRTIVSNITNNRSINNITANVTNTNITNLSRV